MSDIYLNKINNWRDPAILSINQDIAELIPNRTIMVVVPTVSLSRGRLLYREAEGAVSMQIFSAINVVVSAALAKAIPEFNTEV